jgi:hypothetical protein
VQPLVFEIRFRLRSKLSELMSIPGGNNVIGDVARPPAAGRARIPPAAEGRRPRRPAAVPGAGPERGEPAMSDAPVLLEMRSITKEFPGVKALSDVNLVVRSGEIRSSGGCGTNSPLTPRL